MSSMNYRCSDNFDGKTFYAFYDRLGDGVLGNFNAVDGYVYDGIQYGTTEAAYQAQKLVNDDDRVSYSNKVGTSGQAAFDEMKRIENGNLTDLVNNSHFKTINKGLMFDIVSAKFTCMPNMQRILLNTGSKYLVEHTYNDSYWGDGGDGTGKNVLGEILMEVRGDFGGIGVVPRPIEYDAWVQTQRQTRTRGNTSNYSQLCVVCQNKVYQWDAASNDWSAFCSRTCVNKAPQCGALHCYKRVTYRDGNVWSKVCKDHYNQSRVHARCGNMCPCGRGPKAMDGHGGFFDYCGMRCPAKNAPRCRCGKPTRYDPGTGEYFGYCGKQCPYMRNKDQ